MSTFPRLWRRPLSCRRVGAHLQHHLDGEVDARLAGRIAAHLEDCRRCGLEVEVYTAIKASLSQAGPPVEPAAVDRLRAFGRQLVEGGPGRA